MGVATIRPRPEHGTTTPILLMKVGHHVDRRQFLVRMGSFVKDSWRSKSAESLSSTQDTSSTLNRKEEFHVHFGADHACCVSVHAVPWEEYGAISDRWYTDQEYQQFKKDQILSVLNYTNAQRTIALKSNKQPSPNNTFNSNIYTIRGLEHKCGTAISLKYHRIDSHTHRNIVRKVIFIEQQRQRQHETHNADSLEKFREVSSPHTKNERDRARWRAQLYAQEEEPKTIIRRRTMRMLYTTRSHSQPNITMKRNNSSRRFLSLLRSKSSPKQQKK